MAAGEEDENPIQGCIVRLGTAVVNWGSTLLGPSEKHFKELYICRWKERVFNHQLLSLTGQGLAHEWLLTPSGSVLVNLGGGGGGGEMP